MTSGREELAPEQLGPKRTYALLAAAVAPRPIAWVSTRSPDGVDNLAPHSFYTVASIDPPIVQFTSIGRKDTLRNVERTGEFVVSSAPASLIERVNESGVDHPPDVSEFDAAGVAREPSARVAPPRVAAAPVALECTLLRTLPLGGSTVVLGTVVHVAVAAGLLDDGRLRSAAIDPLARLGGDEWCGLGEVRRLRRRRLGEAADGDAASRPRGEGPTR